MHSDKNLFLISNMIGRKASFIWSFFCDIFVITNSGIVITSMFGVCFIFNYPALFNHSYLSQIPEEFHNPVAN